MKKSKKNFADRVSSKQKVKLLNPFEVHINRKKHDVIGKKSKTEKGLPGISRSRAIKKRKATLLQEYKLKGKVNHFVDRRIGERDASMTADDRLLARYTTERMKFHSRKNLFNLGDSEILTHRGESLADIEKFEDPKSDDDDDDDGRNRSGKLEEDFVSEAHFGGGILKKVDGENKSRKDLIDQMIAESKRKKAEMQKLREQTLDMTEKLDTAWKDVMSLMSSKKTKEDNEATLKSDRKYESYDILSKQLMFEPRGKATDRLKSELEVAKEEKEKLEALEKDRQKRMLGDVTEKKSVKPRSADDLDDGFDLDNDYEYFGKKKRKKNDDDDDSIQSTSQKTQNKIKIESSEESSDDSSDGSSNECDDSEVLSKMKDVGHEEKPDEEGNVASDQEDDSDDEADDNDFTDLLSSDAESGDEATKKVDVTKKKLLTSLEALPSKERKDISKSTGQIVEMGRKATEKEILKQSLKGLPFTLSVSDSYEEFEELCNDRSSEYIAVVVKRMIKSNNPVLPDGSRQKLNTLFTYCLQLLQDIASNPSTMKSTFKLLDGLSPWLYDLTHFDPVAVASMVFVVVYEKYLDFLKRCRKFPSLDTLVFLKLVGVLFPTSDFRHRIVTPTILFMQHVLNSCHIRSSVDVAVGLFITTLILEFTALSKRFTPEAINFIRGILRCAQPPDCNQPIIPPFKLKSSYSLFVPTSYVAENISPLGIEDLICETDSPKFKLRAQNLSLELLMKFNEHFDQPSEYLILEPFVPLLQKDNYNDILKPKVEAALEQITALKKKELNKLVCEQKKPRPLKLYEPKIEDVYTFKKKRGVTKEKEEHEKLVHKYRKEVKGALREIRRDNSFLAKLKFNEAKASDLERNRKVKKIFEEAAQQAGDIKKLKRSK